MRHVLSYFSIFRLSILPIFVGLSVYGKKQDECKSPSYTQYASEVTSAFIKEMHRDYGLECGWSGGRMPYDVEEISDCDGQTSKRIRGQGDGEICADY